MNKYVSNNRARLADVGLVLRKSGVFTVGLATTLLGVLRELFVSTEIRQDEESRLHDSDLSGELNYRTGRLDEPRGGHVRDGAPGIE